MLIDNLDYLEAEFGLSVSGKGNAKAFSNSFADAIGKYTYTNASALTATTSFPGFPSTSSSGASAVSMSSNKPLS
jgi:hypothetical protein